MGSHMLRRSIFNKSVICINSPFNLCKIAPINTNMFTFSTSATTESFEGHGILGTYAKALYKVSNNAKKADKVLKDFQNLNSMCLNSKDFQNFILKPSLDKEIKLKFLGEQLEFDKITLSCISLMFENKRIDSLSKFVNILEKINLREQGKVPCQVLHAQVLSQENKEKIKAALYKRLGNNKEPVIDFIESPEIMGGLITKIDGKVLDSSVAGKLNTINKILNS